MLNFLSIKNILLIEKLELDFQSGLNTLTGETGAGKSILLDSLGFAMGWKNNLSILRQGAENGEVIAEFSVLKDSKVSNFLEKHDFEKEETLIIRRLIIGADKRTRNYLNDKACSLDLLRQISRLLVELQGQNDNLGLMDTRTHLDFLDDFASLSKEILDVNKAWNRLKEETKILQDEEAFLLSSEEEFVFLDKAIEEIDKFNPVADEEIILTEKRRQIKAIAKTKELLFKAKKSIAGGDIEIGLTDCINWLQTAHTSLGNVLDKPIEALDRMLIDLSEIQKTISELIYHDELDVSQLEKIEDRLFDLKSLSRKFNVPSNLLPELVEDFLTKKNRVELSRKEIRLFRGNFENAKKKYEKMSAILTKKRVSAAKQLDKLMVAELKHLKMDNAIFSTKVNLAKGGPKGQDSVTFNVATNKGGKLGEINEIASGGELSRFLLALKVCLLNRNQGITLIFDEIDRGVGGATADAVGRRLSTLSKVAQIIVVTHSPQVAAHGDHQWLVSKNSTISDSSQTDVKKLSADARLAEIARMLSGKMVTNEARAAAAELLKKS